MDPLIKKAPWVTKIGHELTFMPTKKFSNYIKKCVSDRNENMVGSYQTHLNRLIHNLKSHLYDNNIDYNDCYKDDACIELLSY